MQSRLKKRFWHYADIILLVAVIALLVYSHLSIERFLIDRIEDFSYWYAPSALKAFDFGEHHFNGSDANAYDLFRAQYFFVLAEQRNESLPYIHHELARIYFIEGDYKDAMQEIDVQLAEHGGATPQSFYVRGLIEGYMGYYSASEDDYAQYLRYDPIDWAAVNDYSWVLLKDGKPKQADAVIEVVLRYFPNNAWLLNSDAIALSELGNATTARMRIEAASRAVAGLTTGQWSRAYTGNDPNIATKGLAAFKSAVTDNMHIIDSGKPIPAVQ